jgi:hypothetical protein
MPARDLGRVSAVVDTTVGRVPTEARGNERTEDADDIGGTIRCSETAASFHGRRGVFGSLGSPRLRAFLNASS